MNPATPPKLASTPLNIADEAFRLAKMHQISPTPKAYEIWHTYVVGKNSALIKHMDSILRSEGKISDYDFEQIHGEFISCKEKNSTHYDVTSSKLNRQMDGILKVVKEYATSSEYFSETLDKNVGILSEDSSPEQVVQTIKDLIIENSAMRDNSTKLMENLSESKKKVQEMQASLKKSQENEMKDALTKMYNRRYFDMMLIEAIADAQQQKTPMCLVMADIDYFKKLNDNYGHPIGDEVLKFVASLLMKNVKGRDTSARYGGEEFGVILPMTEMENAKKLMESIRVQMESANLIMTKGQRSIGKVTASFGIAQFQDSDEPLDLVLRADAKLYEAKNAGRNCVTC